MRGHIHPGPKCVTLVCNTAAIFGFIIVANLVDLLMNPKVPLAAPHPAKTWHSSFARWRGEGILRDSMLRRNRALAKSHDLRLVGIRALTSQAHRPAAKMVLPLYGARAQ
jgi:hypothetical protein